LLVATRAAKCWILCQSYSEHSGRFYAAFAVAYTLKSQLLQTCCGWRLFLELTWNWSFRSNVTWATFFLMLLAYCNLTI